MRTRLLTGSLFVVLAVCASWAQTPLTPAFTYQGQLKQNGQPFNGPANLVFKLYDDPTVGNLLGTQTLNGVVVSAGLFTVQLNGSGEFGSSAFIGERRWLEISVNGTPLSPRQELTAAPNALFSLNATQLNGQPAAFYQNALNINSGTLPDARLSANIPLKNAGNNFGNFINSFAGVVGIGTAAPAARLEVAGDARFSGAAPHAVSLFNGSNHALDIGVASGPGDYSTSATTNDVVLRNMAGQSIHLQTGAGNAALTITPLNKVGIGTTTTNNGTLEVHAGVGDAGYFRSTGPQRSALIGAADAAGYGVTGFASPPGSRSSL